MTRIKDHENEDGSINWASYRAAERAAGEICMNRDCEQYILFGRGRLSLCGDCKGLEEDGEVTHDKLIRCPKCGDSWDPWEREDYHVLADDSHDVSCYECDHDFTVSTSVSYCFTSPPREKDE